MNGNAAGRRRRRRRRRRRTRRTRRRKKRRGGRGGQQHLPSKPAIDLGSARHRLPREVQASSFRHSWAKVGQAAE
jgi:hypothetical protein